MAAGGIANNTVELDKKEPFHQYEPGQRSYGVFRQCERGLRRASIENRKHARTEAFHINTVSCAISLDLIAGFDVMTLKIEKIRQGSATILRLVGRLQQEHLEVLERQIQSCAGEITLDLGELNLISLEGVRFLVACQDQGLAIANASPFITDWMRREQLGN